MLLNGVKTVFGVVLYGVLLAIGFRLGQKAYDLAEQKGPEQLTKLTALVKRKYDDTCRSSSGSKEAGDRPLA